MFPLVRSISQGQPVWIYCNSCAFVLTPNSLLHAHAVFVTIPGGVTTPLPSANTTSATPRQLQQCQQSQRSLSSFAPLTNIRNIAQFQRQMGINLIYRTGYGSDASHAATLVFQSYRAASIHFNIITTYKPKYHTPSRYSGYNFVHHSSHSHARHMSHPSCFVVLGIVRSITTLTTGS